MKTLGAVLAGGLSSRFGSDKALAIWAGRSLLDHALAALRPHCDALVVVGRHSDDIASAPDWPRPEMGPLGGIAGALHHAAAVGYDQLLTISVDCVRLPGDLRALLEPAPSCLESQPVIGLWPVASFPLLQARLNVGQDLSVRRFAREIGARSVQSDFRPPNINHVEDLDRLAKQAAPPL
jgi:molybdopterin-guanine dinucleotide biosynthesis protein A